jgi:Ca2+-binding EF-hand superfamily protein
MKTKLLTTMPLFLSSTLFGTPDLKDNNERISFPIRDHILNRFDSDGDGKLSKNERSEMSKRMQGRKEQLMQKFDANGDGTLNDEEWSKIRKAFQERKAKALKTLNTDGAKSSDQV